MNDMFGNHLIILIWKQTYFKWANHNLIHLISSFMFRYCRHTLIFVVQSPSYLDILFPQGHSYLGEKMLKNECVLSSFVNSLLSESREQKYKLCGSFAVLKL